VDEILVELRRIATALEQGNEYMRLSYEMAIDQAAATTGLTREMTGVVSKLLGGVEEDD
jgi:hypothetical protein